MRAVLSVDIKAVGRGSLTALLSFMALIGVTRFVHVDVQTVFQSVRFGIPHFLTPWRNEDGPGNPTLAAGRTLSAQCRTSEITRRATSRRQPQPLRRRQERTGVGAERPIRVGCRCLAEGRFP